MADLTERVELLTEGAHPRNECSKPVAQLNNERAGLFTYSHAVSHATNWRGEEAIRPAAVN